MWCADGELCSIPKMGIQIPAGGQISSPGRLHITNSELLYLLPKNGVVLSKDWGSNGNLSVLGTLTVGDKLLTPPGSNLCNSNGTICVDIADIKNLMDNAVRVDRHYSIENSFNRGALQAGNAWDARTSSNPDGEWERWRFVRKG